MFSSVLSLLVVACAVEAELPGFVPPVTVPGTEAASARLLQLATCAQHGSLPVTYENIIITRKEGNKYCASGNVHVLEQVEGPIFFELLVGRCDVKLKKDTCEFYTKWETEGCSDLEKHTGPLYKMMLKVDGDSLTKCPLQPMKYKMKDYEINVPGVAASMAANLSNFWYVTITGKNANRTVLCTDIWIEVTKEEPARLRKFG